MAYAVGEDIVIEECGRYTVLPDDEDEDVDFWRWRSVCRHGWENERGRVKIRMSKVVFNTSSLSLLGGSKRYEPPLLRKITAYNGKEETRARISRPFGGKGKVNRSP